MKLRGPRLKALDVLHASGAVRFSPFLCPALAGPTLSKSTARQSKCFSSFYRLFSQAAVTPVQNQQVSATPARNGVNEDLLPLCCPGCGALSQTVNAEQAGYYDLERSAVRKYLKHGIRETQSENATFSEAIYNANSGVLRQLGLERATSGAAMTAANSEPIPICDRCHNLTNHQTGVSIYHPSIDAISATIAESPYKDNHVYHVIDAADFPMSLIPQLQQHLHLSRLRTKNRRSKSHRYKRGGVAEMSFVITRSDLLAPKKEMVDRMMPYLTEVLRDALGRGGHRVRMGILRCVSAKRGWWTKEVKEAIYRRGGGNWMVGKVNVGKSNLFEVGFPKGRGGQTVDMDKVRAQAARPAELPGLNGAVNLDDPLLGEALQYNELDEVENFFNTRSLLPPAPKELLYPQMPVISALPGTTASPIRLPFGNGKGELIDLPGIERSTLEAFVKPQRRLDLIMEHRVSPERISLKPQQSLLIDGLIRIIPKTADLIFLTHSFVPLQAHRTATHKLDKVDAGERPHPLEQSMIADMPKIQAAGGFKSAGTFQLKWDVTRIYSGPVTRKDAAGLKPDILPWIIYAADILIEGCGWVEIHAQVRKRQWFATHAGVEAPEDVPSVFSPLQGERGDVKPLQGAHERFPEVEVFAPLGKFIGVRKPLCAYTTGGPLPAPKGRKHARPRRSMRSVKEQRLGKQTGGV